LDSTGSTALYHRPSGRFEPLGAGLSLFVGVSTGLVLGGIYAYADLYSPIVGVISLLLAGGFGFGTGLVTGSMLRRGKVRNTAVAWGVATLVAAGALYGPWVIWLFALFHRGEVQVDVLALGRDPLLVGRMLAMVNETGAWSFKGSTPTGALLWAIWAGEAVLVAGVALFTATSVWDDQPFCEQCGTWCEGRSGVGVFAATDRESIRAPLEMRDFGVLERLGPATTSDCLRLDLAACPKCAMTHVATVHLLKLTKDGGKTKVDDTVLVEKLLLTPGEADQLRALSVRVATLAATAAALPAAG
jgi:hypothetical protein